MRSEPGPNCLITGGEPVVKLADARERGRGGRNQQLVLAALEVLAAADPSGIVHLSGGTDGEDGPTDAAGAFVDAEIIAAASSRPESRRLSASQRRLHLLRALRRAHQNRPHAHERLRRAGGGGRSLIASKNDETVANYLII